MGYGQTIRIRYADCDMQRVVYNAHYLTFVDDTMDCWLRTQWADFEAAGFDVMLKTATLTWHSPARLADELEVVAEASRWGKTSFDIAFVGGVADRPVFDATVTYVCVDPLGHTPMPIPSVLREFLSE